MRRPLALLVVVALAAGACSTDPASVPTSEPASPSTTSSTVAVGPEPVPLTEPRPPAEIVYFVMTDRFSNGSEANDRAGSESDDPLETGFLPTDKGYFHGGDLAGLADQLDYIAGLGATAIWITPPFRNRAVQGRGEIGNSSAGYHGYWILDFSEVDPHFGTADELRALVDAAHVRGMKVFFDIVVNHTADVITYAESSFSYRSVKFAPYRDAAGFEFDVADYVGTGTFPELDPEVSFAYTPVFASEQDASAKSPEWLNDLTLYHNRGNSTFNGENIELGDFFGLDDLFTEHPRVVAGMIDVYRSVIDDYDIDGFRVDTAKHVNDEFWREFLPAILDHAARGGKDEFFVFGEVSGSDPIFNSRYTSMIGFPSVLDFGFSDAVSTFASGSAGSKVLADHFEDDDWFTTATSDARSLVTFVGNHDMGRLGWFIRTASPGAAEEERLRRAELALGLLFTSRGVPTVYYGDEQGFVGDGGDRDARQDMFASQVDSYNDDDLVGSDATTADANFDRGHPLYGLISDLSKLRRAHPALAGGVQLTRFSQVGEGPFAFSRIDPTDGVEYLVVASNADDTQAVEFTVGIASATFNPIFPLGAGAVSSDAAGVVRMDVPPLSVQVFRADREVEDRGVDSVQVVRPASGSVVEVERFRVEADVRGSGLITVSFAVSVDGGPAIPLGTDGAPPYRVYWDSSTLAAGSLITVTATARGGSDVVTTTSEFALGERG